MFSKTSAVALLAIACVGAAAGGAYLAARHNSAASLSASAPVVEAPRPVHETEALVAPLPAGGAASPPVERAEGATRPAARPAANPPAPAARRAPAARAAERPVASRASADPAPLPPAPVLPADEPLPVLDRAPAPSVEAPLPPMRLFEDVVVPASSVVGLQIETAVSTERARLEDRVEARVLRDVTVDGRTAIPSGTRALGVVTLVERGGKLKDRARLGVQFHTLVLADGTHLPMRSETIFREGESPGAESTRKIGGAAAGGAILGAIIGGKKGAVIGGATGAAGGTAVMVAGERNAATLPAGAVVTVRISEPLMVEVEKR